MRGDGATGTEGLPGLSHMIEANVRCDLWARRAVLVGHVNDGLSDVRPASEPATLHATA